ncbi:MAG TPA: cysteine hydrolase family protein [Bacillales bacterium]|nr:cysteine hydrolase family protein [Bacillales bacterium]
MKKHALLVIDAQQAIIEASEEGPAVVEKEQLLNTINAVIDQSLAADIPIVFIRDVSVAGGEGAGFQVHEAIRVPESAPIFNKSANNAFHETPLLGHLKEHEVEHVIIMGCQTEYCIDSAVRSATDHGFDVTLVSDGHSTTDSPVLKGEEIVKHHNQTLHWFGNQARFVQVRSSEENLFDPPHESIRQSE